MTQELIERLRRTETRTSHVATNRTAPIIESKYQALINPDGPEAADALQSQSARIAEQTKAMEEARDAVMEAAKGGGVACQTRVFAALAPIRNSLTKDSTSVTG